MFARHAYRFAFFKSALLCTLSVADTVADTRDYPDIYDLTLAQLINIEISIATGSKVPLDRAPTVASVFTRGDIEAMGARDLNDIIEQVPGIHISPSGLNRMDSIYSVRGIHTDFNAQMLLLLDGIPIKSRVLGGPPVAFHLPITSIERVEVIRGPGSAVYGADAFSAVLNVITRNETPRPARAGFRSGSQDTHDAWVSGGEQISDWTLGYSASYQHSNSHPAQVAQGDAQSRLDAITGTQASLAPGQLNTNYELLDLHLSLQNEDWNIGLWHWQSTSGNGAGGAQALDPDGDDQGEIFLVDVGYTLPLTSESWNSEVQAYCYHYDIQAQFNLLPPGAIAPIGSDGNLANSPPFSLVSFPDGVIGNPGSTTDELQLEWVNHYLGWKNHKVRTAIGWQSIDVSTNETKNFGPGVIDGSQAVVDGRLTDVTDTSYVYLPDSDRQILFFSLQDEWQIHEDFALVAGIRHDDYSDFGSTTNPRLAAVWKTTDKLTSKLMYGSAFRAPSFGERLYTNNPASLGNPDLKPETIHTLEFSLSYALNDDFVTQLNLFDYLAKDMIENVPQTNTTVNRAENARDQQATGFEVEMDWKVHNAVRLKANYTSHDAHDRETNVAIKDAPRKLAGVTAIITPTTSWHIQMMGKWVGDRERGPNDSRPDLEDYNVIDLHLRRSLFNQSLDIGLKMNNLLNSDGLEPSDGIISNDFPISGRSSWLELTYHF